LAELEEKMDVTGTKVLLLYTASQQSSSPEPITVDFQVYPGGYDRVTLLLNGGLEDNLSFYNIFRSSPKSVRNKLGIPFERDLRAS
jgi:hypothetical protein